MFPDNTEMQLMQSSNVDPATTSVTISRSTAHRVATVQRLCHLVDQTEGMYKEADCPSYGGATSLLTGTK